MNIKVPKFQKNRDVHLMQTAQALHFQRNCSGRPVSEWLVEFCVELSISAGQAPTPV